MRSPHCFFTEPLLPPLALPLRLRTVFFDAGLAVSSIILSISAPRPFFLGPSAGASSSFVLTFICNQQCRRRVIHGERSLSKRPHTAALSDALGEVEIQLSCQANLHFSGRMYSATRGSRGATDKADDLSRFARQSYAQVPADRLGPRLSVIYYICSDRC